MCDDEEEEEEEEEVVFVLNQNDERISQVSITFQKATELWF